MDSATLLHDLAIIMVVAGATALACHSAGLPKVVGYLVAGILVGPHTPGWRVAGDQTVIRALADLGVVFLLFSLGLEFNLRRLGRVGVPAAVIAVVDFTLMTWCGYQCGRALGWTPLASLFLGAVLSDSSTTVLAKLLGDLGWSRARFSAFLFGATLVEDVLAIGAITVLTGLARGGFDAGALADQFGLLWVFLVLVILTGILTVPRLLRLVVRKDPGELMLLVVLGLCFGVSLLAVELGFSVALGAFLIGAVTAESRISRRVELLVAPFRLMFGAVFFVAIGLMVSPAELAAHWALILLLTVLLMGGKTVVCSLAAAAVGLGGRDAVRLGVGMAQVCEFSLILGALGQSLGVTPAGFFPTTVGVCVLSTLLNPILLRRCDALSAALEGLLPGAVRRAFGLYTHWLEHAAERSSGSVVRRVVLRCLGVVLVNLACISGAHMLAAYASARWDLSRLPVLRRWPGANAAVYWLLATLVSLPFFLATAMKLRALGMVLAELSLPFWRRLKSGAQLRGFVAAVFYFFGLVGVLLFAFLVSATFLGSWAGLWLHVLIVAGVLAFGWRRLLRLYGLAQAALRDHLMRELPGPAPGSFTATVGALLDTDMQVVSVTEGSSLLGMTLRDTQLRTRFGVTVVNVERGGGVIPNPEPGLRLENGDRLLLLGTAEQIRAAVAATGGLLADHL